MYMVFSILSNITVALLELCCARSKPDKVATILLDMEELAQEGFDKTLRYDNKRKCCSCISKRSVVM